MSLATAKRHLLFIGKTSIHFAVRTGHYILSFIKLATNYLIYYFRRFVLLQDDQWARRMNNEEYQRYIEKKAVIPDAEQNYADSLLTTGRIFKECPLTDDNLHIHALWIGNTLSKLELLTIHSFIAQGHTFHLWAYDNIITPLPAGVVVENANEIISAEKVFRYKHVNKYGHGKGSVSGFSDIFRYKLLYEKGGWWVDMDVTCLKPLNVTVPYFFRKHHVLELVGNVMKCPPKSALMLACYEEASANVNEENTDWHKPIEILNRHVMREKLEKFIYSDVSNLDDWKELLPFIIGSSPIPEHYRFIHWMNEEWRSREINKGDFRFNSVLGKAMINAGFIKKPTSKFKELWNDFRHLVLLRVFYKA